MGDAQKVIRGYKMRLLLEDTFRITKTKNFTVNFTQLEGENVHQEVTLKALHNASKYLAHIKTRERYDLQANLLFSKDDIKVLDFEHNEINSKMPSHKSPWKKYILAWTVWIIAIKGA